MLFLLPALMFIGQAGCTKESHEVVVMMASGLQSVNDYWIKQGQPENFDPMNTVRSTSETYYSFTNEVRATGTVYHCRFAARSQRVRTPGAIVITDEGVFLWIRDKDSKVIVSPEKNGIE